MKKNNVFLISTVAVVLFYTYSLIMDMVVSFTVYKYDPYFFIKHEANRYLIRFLSGNTSSLILVMVTNILYIVLPSISVVIYLLTGDGYKVAKRSCKILILVMDLTVLILGVMHILGACSWIMI